MRGESGGGQRDSGGGGEKQYQGSGVWFLTGQEPESRSQESGERQVQRLIYRRVRGGTQRKIRKAEKTSKSARPP